MLDEEIPLTCLFPTTNIYIYIYIYIYISEERRDQIKSNNAKEGHIFVVSFKSHQTCILSMNTSIGYIWIKIGETFGSLDNLHFHHFHAFSSSSGYITCHILYFSCPNMNFNLKHPSIHGRRPTFVALTNPNS